MRFSLLLALLLPHTTTAQSDAAQSEATTLVQNAYAAYETGDYDTCGALYAEAMTLGASGQNVAYNAACCFALAGHTDDAFGYLQRALDAGWRNVDHLQSDADLNALHDDPRWPDAIADAETNEAAYVASVNSELYEMYTTDQAERFAAMDGEVDWRTVAENDQQRRTRVYELIDADGLAAADDYFHAAMILQHGRDSTDYRHARDLAEQAIALDPSHGTARWLTAAATDRYLWSIGEPQIYGTQSKTDENDLWTMEPIDEAAVTDAERAAKGVPPLEQAYARLEARNAERRTELDAAAAVGSDSTEVDDGR
jgi:hypothetical protein